MIARSSSRDSGRAKSTPRISTPNGPGSACNETMAEDHTVRIFGREVDRFFTPEPSRALLALGAIAAVLALNLWRRLTKKIDALAARGGPLARYL